MPDQSVLLDKVRRYFEYAGKNVDRAHEIYHDDAVLEIRRCCQLQGVAPPVSGRRALLGPAGHGT